MGDEARMQAIEQALLVAQPQAQAAEARAQRAEVQAAAAVAALEAVPGPDQPRQAAPAPVDRDEGRGNRMIDTRVLGKPSDFSGEPGTWRDWSTIFRAYSSACDPRLSSLMERAERAE